jgi:copper(I)-binding protein
MKRGRAILTGIGLSVLLAVLIGCSPTPVATPTSDLTPFIVVDQAYGQVSALIPGAGEFFMVIKNSGMAADRLVSGQSEACDRVEIREMITRSDGTPELYPRTDPLDIPSRGQTEFKNGGYYHLLCTQMKADQFRPGARIRLTLVFDTSGDKQVNVEVREAPALSTNALKPVVSATAP